MISMLPLYLSLSLTINSSRFSLGRFSFPIHVSSSFSFAMMPLFLILISFPIIFFLHNLALFCEMVFLLAAAGFVRDGHFHQPCIHKRVQYLVPELGAIRTPSNDHEVNQ